VKRALDGMLDSTAEVVTATLTPSFPPNERHVLWLHAQGSDGQWSDFVKVIINPNINDILDKIQANYETFQDLQYDITIQEMDNGVVLSTNTAVEYVKGPYKIRTEYSDGHVTVQNEERSWWHNAELTTGGDFSCSVEGSHVIQGGRLADFFWNIPLAKRRSNGSIQQSQNGVIYACALYPKTGVDWVMESFQVDIRNGFVTRLSLGESGSDVVTEYLNPVEVLPGRWLFTLHRTTISFPNGEQLQVESTISNIRVNQGLDERLFEVLEEPW